MRSRAPLSAPLHVRDDREMRIYAVGDVHGRLDLLESLVDHIYNDVLRQPSPSTRIVILGDFIDRGPSSATIIDLLTRLKAEPHVIVLRGNHEAIMLDAYDGNHSAMDLWLEHGGIATLESFGADLDGIEIDDTRAIIKIARRVIPRRVIAWIRKLPTHVQIGRYYFVHAGIRPGVPLADQRDEDRLWIRETFTESTADHGPVVVHGHTICEGGVSFAPNRIGVDTGAYLTGILSAVAIQGDRLWTVDTREENTESNDTQSPAPGFARPDTNSANSNPASSNPASPAPSRFARCSLTDEDKATNSSGDSAPMGKWLSLAKSELKQNVRA